MTRVRDNWRNESVFTVGAALAACAGSEYASGPSTRQNMWPDRLHPPHKLSAQACDYL